MSFTSIPSRGSTNIPERNREEHGQRLRGQLSSALDTIQEEIDSYNLSGTRQGIYLEFKGDEGKDLVTKSLESIRGNVRLLNVHSHQENGVVTATVFVPNDKKDFFINKIHQYETKNTPPTERYPDGNPRHKDLIQSINSISNALVESFWSDALSLIPEEESKWCEVWLRIDSLDGEEEIRAFDNLLQEHGIQSSSSKIVFPERAVKIVNVNKEQLALLSRYSDHIAEYRLAKECAFFWTDMPPREQTEWVDDLAERIDIETDSNISICILDTGVNNGHTLLSPVLDAVDCQAIDSAWGTHDHHKHGTMMAGIATYGNLEACLATTNPIVLRHKLESIKIMPPPPDENNPKLWGYLTSQGVSLSEIQSPDRKRITCMAIASSDSRDEGRPSSWSASIDNLTFGEEDNQRLMILCAGNSNDEDRINPANYPAALITDSIHDPAQSWNAITVGAYTELHNIEDPTLVGYVPLAPHNTISPFTTTSSVWEDKWPIKPEIVMEGGNLAADSMCAVDCEDLSMLTTNFEPHRGHFRHFNMTSLATAQASWFAAQILVRYPDLWPETIRALMIHSARWTDELISQFDIDMTSKRDVKRLLRICGYGVPSLERALHSASNSLTLIIEEEIQPFVKEGSNTPKTKDMHFHELPWPKDVLQNLPPDIEVEMRVTLSYFIEPGPGEIGGKDKYRYASHMLRFEINSPGETEEELIQRINAAERDEDNTPPGTPSASDYWVIGSQARNKGSIHSDIWKGTAAELAVSNKIAICPGIGWWRERRNLEKFNQNTRYSLVVSITTPSEEVDIYTPVLAQVEVPVAIEIGV